MKSEDQARMHENPMRQSFYKRISGSGRGLGTIFTSHGTVLSRAVEGSLERFLPRRSEKLKVELWKAKENLHRIIMEQFLQMLITSNHHHLTPLEVST